jgi:hypothetical protein
MKKALILGSMLVLVLGLAGCGSSPDSLVKEQIAGINDLADAIEKGEPESKLTDIKKRMEDTSKKLEALKMSDDEKKKLIEKHKDELLKATERMVKAMMSKSKDFGSLFGGGIPGMPQMPQMPKGK